MQLQKKLTLIKPKNYETDHKTFPTNYFIHSVFIYGVLCTGRPVEPARSAANSIEFVKTDGDVMIFKIELTELPAEGCTIIINDAEGNLLFSESIKTTTHVKLYRINKENMQGVNLK